MSKILTIGEPMALLVADTQGNLEEIEGFTRYIAGAEVNFAIGMSRLEHDMVYITKLGRDPFGKYIKNFLIKNRINTDYLKFDDVNLTGMQLKAKVEMGDPEVVAFRKNSAASMLSLNDINDIEWSNIKHVHLTGIPLAISKTFREVIYTLAKEARQRSITVSFDPNLRPTLWSDQAEMIQVINDFASASDIILVGIHEGKLLVGSDDVDTIADFYLDMGISTVIIKLGAKGAFVKTAAEAFMKPGFKVESVVDTVGAGDGFAVGVISALLEGLSLQEATIRGNGIGALAVMSPGDNDGLPDRRQLESFIMSHAVV